MGGVVLRSDVPIAVNIVKAAASDSTEKPGELLTGLARRRKPCISPIGKFRIYVFSVFT